jgi:tetratricopeptide (TPR) repeat protein
MKHLFSLCLVLTIFLVNAQNPVDSLLQNGDYLAALEILHNQKDSYSKFNKSGKIYQQIGNYNSAITYFQKALSLDNITITQRDLAKSFESNGTTKNAIKVYEQLVEKDSLNYLDLYKLGKLYAKTQNRKKAIQIFYKLIKIDPSNPNYHYQIGLNSKNKFERVEAFLNAYYIDTLHSRSIYHIAKFFKTIDDADSARIFINKGIEINANSSKFLRLKIADLYKTKDYKETLEYALHLDSLVSNDLFAKQRIGLSYWKMKDYKNAEMYLRQAVKIDRKEKTTFYYLGLIYKDMENYKLAKLYFMMAIALDKPDIDNEHYNLGLIAQKEKEPQKAIDHFSKSFQNNPRNYMALFELAVMSDLYYKDKLIALKHYEKYTERFSDIHKENTAYTLNRIKEIKELLFFKGDE